jgi:transposase-like protein/soluble lytic murein transglycosylase-like protein
MSERFRQFQALFPEEACLAALMRLRHGGTSMSCPACGRPAQFEPRPKLRGFACQHCHYMIHPAAGTPLESRRTPLQLWFYALKTMSEQAGKAAVSAIARDAAVPQVMAQRIVDDLAALAERGDPGWLEVLKNLVTGKPEAAAVPVVPGPSPSPSPIAPRPNAPAPVRREPMAPPRSVPAPVVPAPASSSASPPVAAPPSAPRTPAAKTVETAAAPDARPKKAASGRKAIAAVAAGVACVAAAVLGLAYARLQQQERPEPERGIEIAAIEAPALKDAPARPSLILSSVEQDLEGARQAAQFALDNDPSLAAIKPQDEAPPQQVPVNQLQLPSNILLVPPKMQSGPPPGPVSPSGAPQPPPQISSGDPDQILTFGPIKIRRHLVDTIVRASKVVGADPTLLMAVADKESSFSTAVKAQTSSATGLYQFIEQTWLGVIYEFGAKHGLGADAKLIGKSGRQFVVSDAAQRQRILDMRREPYISALLAAEMLKRDTLRLERALGRHLTGGEIYLIHFLGPDAAQTFIETMEEQPGVKAADLLPKPAQANRPIFYADAGGETKVLTVSEVHKKFNEMIKVRLDRYSAVRPGQGPGIARPQPKK